MAEQLGREPGLEQPGAGGKAWAARELFMDGAHLGGPGCPDDVLQRELCSCSRRWRQRAETWRMTVERRTDATRLDPSQVIRSLAGLIDARVDLAHPDKIVLVQLFDDWVSLSVAPSERFSVVTMLAARPIEGRAPNSADEPRGG